MMNLETEFIFYLKNYALHLESFIHASREEFYTGKMCEKVKMFAKSKEGLDRELNNIKSIIRSYERFRKNN